MKPETLKETAALIFGKHWKSPLSKKLKVHRNTVYKWSIGEILISNEWEDKIYLLLAEHTKKVLRKQKQH